MNDVQSTTSAAFILEERFDRVKVERTIPALAYGASIAGATVAQRNESTPFRIASMTKSFTAAAVMLLRDAGALHLDQPVAALVPELAGLMGPTTDSPPVTVRHLLTMSSGLATDDAWADRHLDADPEQMDNLFRAGGFFASPVGTRFVYSNYGYAVLGRVVSNVAEMPFHDFIMRRFLEPLAMTSTTWEMPPGGAAQPFRSRDGITVPDGTDVLGLGGFSAMGGLWSTVADLLIWATFFLDAFPARDGVDTLPLCRATRREMQQMWTAITPSPPGTSGRPTMQCAGYGMGLVAQRHHELGLIVSHTGGLPGYGSNMAWLPDRQVAVVSLANITYAPMFAANFDALSALHAAGALPPERSIDRGALTEYANRLIALFNAWDDDAADALFADNVRLDEPYERRQLALAALVDGDHPWEIRGLTASDATTAVVDAVRARINFAVSISLTPQVPPRVQAYTVTRAEEGEPPP